MMWLALTVIAFFVCAVASDFIKAWSERPKCKCECCKPKSTSKEKI